MVSDDTIMIFPQRPFHEFRHRRYYTVPNGLPKLWESVLERIGQIAAAAFQRDRPRPRILVQDLLDSAVEWHTLPCPTNFLTFA